MKLQKSLKTVKVCILLLTCASFLFGCEHTVRTEENVIGQVVDRQIEKVKIEGDCTQIPIGDTGIFMPICDDDKEEEHFNVTVQAHGITTIFNDKSMFESKEKELPVIYIKEVGEESNKVYDERLILPY
ncbi:TPA: hypothetical protein ACGW65_000863 [Bacillus paranthracis]